jgi:[protein-PII] uridylyltransferase
MKLPLLPPAADVEPAPSGDDPLAGLKTALEQLAPAAAPGISSIAATRSAWGFARTRTAQVNRVQGGPAAGAGLADFTDALLKVLLAFAARRAGLMEKDEHGQALNLPGVAILALGSYARRDMAPYSDIDLLVLHADGVREDTLELLAGNLLRPLWDAGLQVGHAVRSREQCLAAAKELSAGNEVLESTTAMLEARFVAGDSTVADRFYTEDLPQFFRTYGRNFVDAKHEETIARWQGLSVYRTQPHLKNSPGAMRDYQTALWIDRASHLSGYLARLQDRPLVSPEAIADARTGYERLLTFRIALHALCQRRQDVLDYAMQEAVAEDLGYKPTDELRASERLLRDYYRAATAIHRLAQTVTRRYLEERAIALNDAERMRRQKVDDDFVRVGDYLYLTRHDVFDGAYWLEPAMRAFLHAARLGLTVSQEIAEAVRARAAEMSDIQRDHPAAALHFGALLRLKANVGRTLRAMRDAGLLGAYIPEFGEVEGVALHDLLHDYTVDEHTLLAVEAVDDLYRSAELGDQFRLHVLECLPRPLLLRLACLFHDLGKSRGAAGHSQRGALMIPGVGERLGLSAADERTLIFLVQEHLLLSKVSQRRDPGEGELLRGLAEKIATKERLDLLYLLSYCDARAVGHGAYPAWKDALLTELYRGILARLPQAAAPAETPVAAPTAIEAGLQAWARNDEDRALAEEHCRRVPLRYLAEVSIEEAVLHLETLKRMRTAGKEAVAAVAGEGGLVDIWVVSTDRPRRFSQICGAFLSQGVNIVSAIAYTRADGIILDHFRVTPGPYGGVRPDFWERVATGIEESLAGTGDMTAKIEDARRRIPHTPQLRVNIPPEVRVDNKVSSRFTVVDVICGDRIGLLYGLSRALADLNCDIHFAKIATTQGVATDVFYVTEIGGGQVTDRERIANLRRLLSAVAADFQEEKR